MRTHERSRFHAGDLAVARLDVARLLDELAAVSGHGAYALLDEHGRVRQTGILAGGHNLITDTGDEYYAKRGGSVAVNVPTGMRLGTGSTAPAKNGAGSSIVTYVAGSQHAFDGGFPTVATLGAGLGWRVQYRATWAAGVATANGIAEATITNETPLTDIAGSAAVCIARALLSPVVNKGAGDTLAVTWNHDLLGA